MSVLKAINHCYVTEERVGSLFVSCLQFYILWISSCFYECIGFDYALDISSFIFLRKNRGHARIKLIIAVTKVCGCMVRKENTTT